MEDTRGSRPVPDPTVLTTDQLRREITGLRELIETRITAVLQLHEEKFNSIDTRFAERDKRVEQGSRDNKMTVDLALQTAKEAVGKTEVGFTKQIDMLAATITSNCRTMDGKISDIKERLNIIEGRAKGIGESWGMLVGAVGMALAAATVAFEIIQRLK